MVQGIEVLSTKPDRNPAPVTATIPVRWAVVSDSISLQLVAADQEDDPSPSARRGYPTAFLSTINTAS